MLIDRLVVEVDLPPAVGASVVNRCGRQSGCFNFRVHL